jgi:hypothetical protein
MITGVMLSWKRPDNVQKILDGWAKDPLIDEAIIWNNNPDIVLPQHPWAKIINAQQDLGLYTRFLAAQLASNDCILIHDDDLYLPPESVAHLYAAWQEEPNCLHGRYGRKPTRNNGYAIAIEKDGRAPIMLTRAVMTHKQWPPLFFLVAPQFEELQRAGKPYGNGEDIIFSYAIRQQNGNKLHYVHKVPVQKLPAPYGIHHVQQQNHVAHRSRVVRACEKWLERTL